ETVTTISAGKGGFSDGPGAQAQFWSPQGLALFQGALVCADKGHHRVRRIDLEVRGPNCAIFPFCTSHSHFPRVCLLRTHKTTCLGACMLCCCGLMPQAVLSV